MQYDYPGLMQDLCRASGILKVGKVGKSFSGLMRARDFESFLATAFADDPSCLVLRPPDRDSSELAIDAMQKAAAMLKAWQRGPRRPASGKRIPLQPIAAPGPKGIIREDCPAFAGFHLAAGSRVPLCRANGRHPDYFRLGGAFNEYGLTTCEHCSWHEKYPSTNTFS